MLSKNDKEFIKQTIREELEEALTAFLVREITVEKGPRKNGDPEKRIEKEKVNMLEFQCGYLPQIEGALRGAQADMNKVTNKTGEMQDGLAAIAGILIESEKAIKQIATRSIQAINAPFFNSFFMSSSHL